MTKSLDLGCGVTPKNPFNADEVYGIDVREDLESKIKKADLVIDPIPYADETFDYVTAYDLIEHIPRVIYAPVRRKPFVELMSEVYRVLKPGGIFLSSTPGYPHAAAFIDPTHVNFISEGTLPYYFGDKAADSPWAIIYGFKGAFAVKSEEWQGPHLLTVLQKISVPADKDKVVNNKPIDQDSSESHAERVYRAHMDHDQASLAEADETFRHRLDSGSIDWWRHKRLWEPVLQCLSHTKENTWLTVGDTFGSDAFQMMREGFKHVLPTSIDSLMLEEARRRGLIENFSVENAEKLSFEDKSFDYVLCREAYHHFPRPMIALYEMIRVARKAVVLIEPQDPMIDDPVYTGTIAAGYEKSANYIYTLSRRELIKVALGLNLHVLACRGVFDIYKDEIAKLRAQEDEPEFVKYRQEIEGYEQECRLNKRKHGYLLAILYLERPAEIRQDLFSSDWSITYFPENPYLAKKQ